MSNSKHITIWIIIGIVIGTGSIFLYTYNSTLELRVKIQEQVTTILSFENEVDSLQTEVENLTKKVAQQDILLVEQSALIENLQNSNEQLSRDYNELYEQYYKMMSQSDLLYQLAQDGYGEAYAKCIYDLGIRGVILLYNASSNTRGDFISKFEEVGGTILFGDDLNHEFARTNVLDNANFFAQAYTTDTEYNNWYWISREGFNQYNVMLVTFGLNENIDIYNYNGNTYPYLASLLRIDLLDRYPPDL